MKRLLIFLVAILWISSPCLADTPIYGGGSGWTPQADCSTVTANGSGCWDNDTYNFYIGNGTSAQLIGGASTWTNPMSAVGDIIYGGTAGAATRLAPNTTTTPKVLSQTGTGSAGQAPTWESVGYTITSHSASESATAATLWGNQMHLVTGAYKISIPTGVAGMSATFCSTTAAVFSLDSSGSDTWILGGVTLTAANQISSDGSAGACVHFVVTATNALRVIWTNSVFIDGGAG